MQQTPHILLLPSWYPVKGNELNGIFNREWALMMSETHKITMLHLHFPEQGNRTYVVKNKVNENFYETIVYLNPGGNFFTRQWRYFTWFFKMVKELIAERGSFSLIHNMVVWKMGIPALWMKWRLKLPLVITEHFTGFLPEDNSISAPRKRFSMVALRSADAVAAVSKGLAHALAKYGAKQVKVIPNFPDAVFLNSPVEIKKSQDPFYFLHVSTFDDRQKQTSKIIREFVRLKKEYPHIFLMLVVPEEKLEQYFYNHPDLKSDGIIFCEPTENKVIYLKRFQQAHAYISYSIYETFGITVLEALCCGLPVIYTVSGGPEHFTEADMGLVCDKNNPVSLYETMEKMLLNYNYDFEKIAEKSRKKFSKETIRSEYASLYETVLIR